MSFLTNITSVTTNGDVLEDVESIAKPFDFVAALSNLANGSNAGPDPTQETSLLQPTAYTLVNDRGYLKLDGLTGSYVSVPHEAALSVLGDLEIIANFEVQETGINQSLGGKYAAGEKEYLVNIDSTAGNMVFFRGEGNTTAQAVVFTTTYADLKPWLKVTHRLSDQRVQLYLSDDGIAWTQFGADKTMAAVTPAAGTQKVEIGAYNSGTSDPIQGSIYRTIIKDGIDGTTVLDIDFTKEIDAHGASTITAETGQEVTLNGGALLIRDAFIYFDKTASDHFDWVAPAFSDAVLIVATKNGTYSGTIDSNTLELSAIGFTTGHTFVDEDLVGVFVGPSTITAAQKAKVIAEFVKQGGVESFSGVTNFGNRFRDAPIKTFDFVDSSNVTNFSTCWYDNNLTSFPLIDTSSGTTFSYTFYGNNFTSFPLIDTSSGTTFKFAWRNCSSLVDFPAGFFDSWSPASVTNECFDRTWTLTPSLSAESVLNILNSIDASGVYGTTSGLVGGTALGDAVIDIDYDNAETAPDVTDVVMSLLAKGWTVNLNAI